MSALARCQSCGAGMLWAGMPGGARMPLDPEATTPALGLVAYFDGRGRMVDDLEVAGGWAESGATFHVAHFSSCPGASRHRVSRAQEAMF